MISQKWIDQQRGLLSVWTDPEVRAAKLAEIEAAEKELAEQKGKLAAHGLRVNAYPGKCVVTGQFVDGGQGYCRQDPKTRKWLTYSKAGAATVFNV